MTQRQSTSVIVGTAPLSPLAQGLLFHEVKHPGSRAYQEQCVFRVQGQLDATRLQAAFARVIARYSSLRSAFVWESERGQMAVIFDDKAVKMPLETRDWRELSKAAQLEALQALLEQDLARGYDLRRPPLMRVYLVQLTETSSYVVLCHHHLVLDGWSLAIVLREVLGFYTQDKLDAQCLDERSLATLEKGLVRWRQDLRPSLQEETWRELAKQGPASTQLPGDLEPAGQAAAYQELRIHIDRDRYSRWSKLCRAHKLTPSSLLVAAYALVLGRFTGSERMALGMTLSGRPATLAHADKAVGLLINTLPLVVGLQPCQSVAEYLTQVASRSLWLQERQGCALSDVQRWMDQSPSFETVFVFDNYPIDALATASKKASMHADERSSLQLVTLDETEHQALASLQAHRNQYPLTLVAVPKEQGLMIAAAYDATRFSRPRVQALLDAILQAVDEFDRAPNIGQIRLTPPGKLFEHGGLASPERLVGRDAGQASPERPVGQASPERPAGQASPERPAGHERPAGQASPERPAGRDTVPADRLPEGPNRLAEDRLVEGPNRLADGTEGRDTMPADRLADSPNRLLGAQLRHHGAGALSSAPALVHLGPGLRQQLSYAQLADGVARMAAGLVQARLPLQSPVILHLERSAAWVIAWLGLMEAGLVVVPVDPADPSSRRQAVARRVGAKFVISDEARPEYADQKTLLYSTLLQTERGASWRELPGQRGLPELGEQRELTKQRELAEPPELPDDALAYILMTSGSTGMPKGVAVTHANLRAYAQGCGLALDLAQDSKLAWLSGVAVDLGLTSVLCSLYGGHCLVVPEPALAQDPDGLAQALGDEAIDVLKLAPTHLLALLEAARSPERLIPRKIWISGGETLTSTMVDKVKDLVPSCRIRNHYGPTETTVGVCMSTPGSRSLGQPLGQARLTVRDRCGERLPAHAAGELWIAGPSVAQGYWNDPRETAQRFVPDPCGPAGARAYRSGDRMQVGLQGLEFLGRIDAQLKIRGFRCEPGEVEAWLCAQGCLSAVVMAEPGPKPRHLWAIYHPGQDAKLDPVALKAKATAELAAHLVPARLVPCEDVPRLPSGKVDRQAAMARLRQAQDVEETSNKKPPTSAADAHTDILQTLAKIWSEALGKPVQEPSSNFFALGGDSILSLQVVAKARRCGFSLGPKDLFDHPTLGGLAQHLGRTRPKQAPLTVAKTRSRMPAEHWLDAQTLDDPHHFHQSLIVPLAPIEDMPDLASAAQQLGERHKLVHNTIPFFEQVYIESWGTLAAKTAIQDRCQQLSAKLRKSGGPRLLLRLFVPAKGQAGPYLAGLAHHSAVDAVSWRILLGDLAALYRKEPLPEPALSAASLAQALQKKVRAGGFDHERDYWLAQRPEATQASPSRHKDWRHQAWLLDADTTHRLREGLARTRRLGLLEALVASLTQAFVPSSKRWVIELESHGRHFDDAIDASQTVAWCTARYPVACSLAEHEDWMTRLDAVADTLDKVPGDGSGFGALRYLSQDPGELATMASADATLNYLGQSDRLGLWKRLLDTSAREHRPELAHQRCPNWRRSTPLSVTAQIRQGQLSVRIDYDPARWSTQAIERNAETMRQALCALADEVALQPPALWHRKDLGPMPYQGPSVLDPYLSHLQSRGPIERVYVASSAQRAMWQTYKRLEGTQDRAYWNQLSMCWHEMGPEKLQTAICTLMAHHELLRTLFVQLGEHELAAVVMQTLEAPVQVYDLVPGSKAQEERAWAKICASIRAQGLPLQGGAALPWQVTLGRGDQGRVWMCWTRHHILLDGWSHARLLEDFARALRGEPCAPYPSYASYLRWLAAQDPAASSREWVQLLQDYSPMPMRLGSGPHARGQGRAAYAIELEPPLCATLREQAAKLGGTLNHLLELALGHVISHWSQRSKVLLGIVDAGRPAALAGSEAMMGLLMQNLPLPLDLSPQLSLADALSQTGAMTLKVQSLGALGLDLAQQSQWNLLLVFENYPISQVAKEMGGEHALDLAPIVEEAHYPLTLTVNALGDASQGMRLRLAYDRGHYDQDTAQQLLSALTDTLEAMARASSQTSLGDLGLTLPALSRVPSLWTPRANIATRVLDVAKIQQNTVALIDPQGQTLSYADLASRAKMVAKALRARGVGLEVRVGICLAPGIDQVVAILGVLLAGGAYVPLDPSLPKAQRQALMAKAQLVGWVGPSGNLGEVLRLEQQGRALATQDWQSPQVENSLAYLIFTSGSSGQPKAVGVEHRQVSELVQGLCAQLDLGPGEVWTMFHRFAFDVSVWELFGALCSGATLQIIDDAMRRDPQRYARCLHEVQASVISETPSAYYLLQSEFLAQQQAFPGSLHTIMFAGEALDATRIEPTLHKVRRVLDLYGTTETTIHATLGQLGATTATVGQALVGRRLDIVSASGRELVPGSKGEIAIAGSGVSRGYLQDPRATAARFVPDPQGQGTRRYLSGDLGRIDVRGDLIYLGRGDRQVQLRGFRVELGAVEAQISALCAGLWVHAQVVGEMELATLWVYIQDASSTLDIETLRSKIQDQMAEHMRPSKILCLERFPLTANGKLDRAKLYNQATASLAQLSSQADPPSHRAKLQAIWREILRLEGLQALDDSLSFFALGGHSLQAVTMLHRVQSQLGVRVSLAEFLSQPTLEALESRVRTKAPSGLDGAKSPIAVVDDSTVQDWIAQGLGPWDRAIPVGSGCPRVAPVTPEQHELFAASLKAPADPRFHLFGVFDRPQGLTLDALQRALAQLVQRHGALRTRFVQHHGELMQELVDPSQVDMQRCVQEVQTLDVETRVALPFDLEVPGLWRVALGEEQMLVVLHHLIADAWSVELLARELQQLLEDETSVAKLAPCTHFVDYAAWRSLFERAKGPLQPLGPKKAPRAGFWVAPTDASKLGQGQKLRLIWDRAQSQALHERARSWQVSPFALLLTGYFALLDRLRPEAVDPWAVASTAAHRPHPQLEHSVGYFVQTMLYATPQEDTLRERALALHQSFGKMSQTPERSLGRVLQELRRVNPDLDANASPALLFVVHERTSSSSRFEGRTQSQGFARFALSLRVFVSSQDETRLSLEYMPSRWSEATVQDFAREYALVMDALTQSMPDQALAQLPELSSSLRDSMLQGLHAPAPRVSSRSGDALVKPAQNRVQAALLQIWRELLGQDDIGPQDNFFERGGDSIASLQVVARVLRRGWTIRAQDLVQAPTVEALAERVRTQSARAGDPRMAVTKEPRLTPAQRWWFSLPLEHPAYFNQSMLLVTRPGLSMNTLVRAFARLVQAHEALRTGFVRGPQGPRARPSAVSQDTILDFLDTRIHFVDQSKCSAAQASQQILTQSQDKMQAHNLESGGLFQVLLFDRGYGQEGRLLMIFHHLIIDGVSWRMLLAQLDELARDEQAALVPSTPFALDLAEPAPQGPQVPALSPCPGSQKLPDDPAKLRPRVKAVVQTLSLGEELCRDGTSRSRLLLAAWVRALRPEITQGPCVVDVESHGRQDLEDPQAALCIGWLTQRRCVEFGAPAPEIDATRDQQWVCDAQAKASGARKGVQFCFNDHGSTGVDLRDTAKDEGGMWARPLRLGQEAVAPSRSPQDPRPYPWTLNASLRGEKLHLQLLFDPSKFQESRVQAVLDRMANTLAHYDKAPVAPGPDPQQEAQDEELAAVLEALQS